MKSLKRKNGFSMVEVLVASAFVATLAVTGLTSYNYMRNLRNRSTDVCRIHVAGVVEKFRSIGYFSAINNFNPVTGSRSFTGNSVTSLKDSKGIPNDQLWPSLDVLGGSPSPTLNNSVLISSSINALLAIYNSNSQFCTSSGGATYTGEGIGPSLVTNPSGDLKDSTINLHIVPYDINTGGALTPVACPMPLRIAPEPAPGGSNVFTLSPPKVSGGDTKYNTGLLVRVIENYTNEDGQASSCSIEQRFQYSPDLNAPLPPNMADMVPSGTSVGSCISPNRDVTVTFGYDPAQSRTLEPGAVMVCRDTSMTAKTPAPGHATFQCRGGPPGLTQVIGRDFPSPGALAPGTTGIEYAVEYGLKSGPSGGPWVPCDQVSACGIPPDSATLLGGATTDKPRYQLRYLNLPAGCRVNIEIAAIDTASNSSTNYLTAGTAGNKTVPESSMTRLVFDVPVPLCGSAMCGTNGANSGLSPGNVYFQCPACP